MRKLLTTTFITLDGVMQAPGGPGEDDDGGFTQGGWSVHYWDEALDAAMGEIMGREFEFLLGRKTYEIFAAYWPTSTEVGADVINNARKHVVSRSLEAVDWNNTTLIRGDAVPEIARLKAMDGPELQVHGSSNLIQTLLKNDLIDEIHLFIFPVAIGKGKRYFGDGTDPAAFKLASSTTSNSGVIIATYVRDGALQTGTFGV
ncbi:MAG TPA: dihydrofolate reductase family protein [Anaerolineales bacterium]|nr:dihydrofolate reductase family protein [Anaerolineales bacterium]